MALLVVGNNELIVAPRCNAVNEKVMRLVVASARLICLVFLQVSELHRPAIT